MRPSTRLVLMTPPFTLTRLFRGGAQGGLYDWAAGQYSSLFQDSTGTTPVTALEQPVGLVLDSRYGLVRGSELWVAPTPNNASVTYVSDVATFTASSVGNAVAIATALTINKTYELTCRVTAITAGSLRMYAGSGSSSAAITVPGSYRSVLTCSGTTAASVTAMSAGTSAVVDSISFREIPGNHLIQPTSTARPVLSARYNLLTNTEDLTTWSGANRSVTPGVSDPNGGTSAFTITATGANGEIYKNATVTAGTPVLSSAWVRRRTGTGVVSIRNSANSAWTPIAITGTWARFTNDGGAAGASAYTDLLIATSGDAIDVWHPDMRLTADTTLPSYQRVNTSTDYDSDGFPVYLKPDGADDFLYSASTIDFTGTDKMTVIAGVSKLSEAATAMLMELSADLSTNNGSFYITAPSSAAAGTYRFAPKGTVEVNVTSSGTYTPPHHALLTCQAAISADQSSLRVNGTSFASSADLGNGAFGNHTLYVGARAGTSLRFGGRIFPFAIVGAAVTDTNIVKAEQWLARNRMKGLVNI